MTQQNSLALAKQGDIQAIVYVVSYFLKDKSVKVKANIQNGCIFLTLESNTPLEKVITVHAIRDLLKKLAIPQVTTAKIQNKLEGVAKADWLVDINLGIPQQAQPSQAKPEKSQLAEKAIALPSPNSSQKQLSASPETQANNPPETQPESKNIFLRASRWSPLFPYPNSWLRTIGLIIWVAVVIRITMFWAGMFGVIMSTIVDHPEPLFRAIAVALLISIIIFVYTHHLLFGKRSPSFKYLSPNPISWWQGILAPIVSFLSIVIVLVITIPFIPINDCNFYLSDAAIELCLRNFRSYSYRTIEILSAIGLTIWVFSIAYLYQIEFLIRKNFSAQKFIRFLLISLGAFLLSIFVSFTIRNYQPIQGVLQGFITKSIDQLSSVASSPPSVASSPATPSGGSATSPAPTNATSASPATSTTMLPPPSTPTSVPTATPQAASSPVQADPFVLGTENALKASKLVQVAKTKAEWQKVEEDWGSAVTFMQVVPASHPKYTIAQQKVIEYQSNLDYAKRAGALAAN